MAHETKEENTAVGECLGDEAADGGESKNQTLDTGLFSARLYYWTQPLDIFLCNNMPCLHTVLVHKLQWHFHVHEIPFPRLVTVRVCLVSTTQPIPIFASFISMRKCLQYYTVLLNGGLIACGFFQIMPATQSSCITLAICVVLVDKLKSNVSIM